jgi:hypothetical protein
MRFEELTKQYKFFKAKVKIKQPGYSQLIDTTVTAKDRTMAQRLLKAQYGKNSVIGTVTEIK